jgi:hypothetical protein
VGGGAELDAGRGPADVVVQADLAAEPFGQRVDDGPAGDAGRDDDQYAVAAVLVPAAGLGDAGAVEGFLEDSVEFLVQVPADVVVAVRPGVSGDVDGDQGADLAVRRGRWRPGGRAAHGATAAETAVPAAVRWSSAQKLISSSSLSICGGMPARRVRPVASVQLVMSSRASSSSSPCPDAFPAVLCCTIAADSLARGGWAAC